MRALGFALLAALLVVPASASDDRLDVAAAYEKSQAAIGGQTTAHVLVDHRNRPLALSDLRGKPLVVSIIFTSCATVCPLVTDHLRDQVLLAQRALGPEAFNVLTFGFDASGDRPAQLAAFAGTHRFIDIPGWHIASAGASTSAAFLDELGFSFRGIAGGFDHVTQTTVLDKDGRVYAQIRGDNFPLPVLVEPLKELVFGITTRSLHPADLWDRISFLCTVYNPLTGAYRFDYSIFFGMFFGGLSLILTGYIILRLWLERRRSLRVSPPISRGTPS
jgi:protein SCO1/2